jgi:integrase
MSSEDDDLHGICTEDNNMASLRKRTVDGETRWDVTVTRQGAPRQSKTFSIKSAADRWARETEREIERGAWRSTGVAERLTVGALMTRYRDEILPAKRSAAGLQGVANKIIRSNLGSLPLIALTTQRVAEYRDERLRTRATNGGPFGKPQKHLLSTQTVRHEIALLKRGIDQGIREWGLYLPAGNPVSQVRLPPMGRPRDRRLTPDEYDRLLKTARASRCKILPTAIELAVETAMRREELCSLAWVDVDLNRRVAHLHLTKNGEPRDVPLSTRSITLLSQLVRPIRGPVLGIKGGALSQAFRRVSERAKLEDLHWHDLRHEATSRLAERLGNDVMALAAVTGHKTLQMLKRYTHLRAEDLARRLA